MSDATTESVLSWMYGYLPEWTRVPGFIAVHTRSGDNLLVSLRDMSRYATHLGL